MAIGELYFVFNIPNYSEISDDFFIREVAVNGETEEMAFANAINGCVTEADEMIEKLSDASKYPTGNRKWLPRYQELRNRLMILTFQPALRSGVEHFESSGEGRGIYRD